MLSQTIGLCMQLPRALNFQRAHNFKDIGKQRLQIELCSVQDTQSLIHQNVRIQQRCPSFHQLSWQIGLARAPAKRSRPTDDIYIVAY